VKPKPAAERQMLALESPWTCQPGVVRVPRRRGESASTAVALRADREGMTRPYIFENGAERRLHFTQDATQSAMSLLDPDSLIAPYTRKMMAFLLLNPNPRHIVMLGLGGGSLAKFCYRYLPKTRITAVEIDEDVIAMRDEFLIPRDDARFRVVHDEGARYLARIDEAIDVLLVDAFDQDGVAVSLCNPGFCQVASRLLTDRGVLVMNFSGKTERYTTVLKQAASAFGKHAMLVSVSGELNVLLFATRHAPPTSITVDLETVANRLQQILKLDFPRYLRRICQGHALIEMESDPVRTSGS
jgi:spermidine synthase